MYIANQTPTVVSLTEARIERAKMNTSNAEMYGRRAEGATEIAELGENVKKAIRELANEIKQLNARVARLESEMRRR
jgi:uncharacterized protein YlxW (UPF0749 family)